MKNKFDDRKSPKRYCMTVDCAGQWDCYEGSNDGIRFVGRHVGRAESDADADSWLRGEDDSVILRAIDQHPA